MPDLVCAGMKPYIVKPGQIRVNHGYVSAHGPRCVLWQFDLRSKWPEHDSICYADEGISIALSADERTLYWDRRYKRPTEILFPKINDLGWSVHSHSISKYTLSVALIRHKKR